MFYTYVWRDASGTPFYVGKGTKRRAQTLSKRSADFMAVHAAGGCTVEIVDEFILESQAHEHEMRLIERYGRREFGGLLVNRTDGGEGLTGLVHSGEAKNKIGAASRGKPRTDEVKAKISAAKRGKPGHPISAETKAKMRAVKLGKRLTQEAKDKVRAARLGKPRSLETIAKMRAANLGKTHSEQSKVKRQTWARRAPPKSTNTTGFKGVLVDSRSGRCSARLKINGKNYHLGCFGTHEEAARAYDAAAIAAWGVGNCYLNFPPVPK